MYKKRGFTSFEFYFVMVVIGVIVLVGLQRYLHLAEQVQRFSFEVLAKNFSTAVYNARSQWLIQHQEKLNRNIIDLSGVSIQMSEQGWPMSAAGKAAVSNTTADSKPAPAVSLYSCHQLWLNLLQNPEPISFAGGDAFGTRKYHLLITVAGGCRYQLYVDKSNQYYFDYLPSTGQVIIHTPAELRK